jgi:hypothetical protein
MFPDIAGNSLKFDVYLVYPSFIGNFRPLPAFSSNIRNVREISCNFSHYLNTMPKNQNQMLYATKMIIEFYQELDGKKKQLASDSGISPRNLSRIFNADGGTRSSTATDIWKAAKGLGFSGAREAAFTPK